MAYPFVSIAGYNVQAVREYSLDFSAILEEEELDSGDPHLIPIGVSSISLTLQIRTSDPNTYVALFQTLHAKAKAKETIEVSGFIQEKAIWNGSYYLAGQIREVPGDGYMDMTISLKRVNL